MMVMRLIYSLFFIFTAFADDSPTNIIKQSAYEEQKEAIGNVIIIIPETGKYKFIGDEVKSAIQIYLNNFSPNNAQLIFVDENDKNFIELIKAYIKLKPKILTFIGPVFSKNTKKLAELLDKQRSDIIISSLSNDSSLDKFSNVATYGFNIEDKIDQLVDEIVSREEGFDKIYLVYNGEGLDKDFKQYVREAFSKKTDKKIGMYKFRNVREFSWALKAIAPKEEKQGDKPQKSAIIFINLGSKITPQLNNFLKKYQLSPKRYDFYFLSNVLSKAKFDENYKEAIYIVNYDFSDYVDFTKIFQEKTGKKPSGIAYSVYDIFTNLQH